MKTEMRKTALAAAIGLLASSAYAGPLSWTEVGVGYLQADSGNDDIAAYDLRGSIGLGQLFHVQAGYTDGTADNAGPGGSDYDFDGYDIRAGVHPSVGEKTQAVVDLIYFDYSGEADDEEDGVGVGFGVRHQMGDQFEARAQIDYVQGSSDPGGDDFTNTTYSFGGRYYWSPAIFTGVTVFLNGAEAFSIAGGGDVIRADVGWSFGGDVM
jgi:hypothetical protein